MRASFSQCLCAVSWVVLLNPMVNVMTPIVPAAARVSCEIKAMRDDTGARLDAVIRGTGPIAGTFVFTVRKRSGGKVISQSGDFKVENASPAEIKKASIDLEPGQAYDAHLDVKWPNGSSSCSSSIS